MKGVHIVLHIILVIIIIIFSIDLIDSFLKYFDSINYKNKKLTGEKYNIVSFQYIAYHNQSRNEDYEKNLHCQSWKSRDAKFNAIHLYCKNIQTEIKDNLNR